MPTTDTRIRHFGEGLIGVCQENFLTASHNKASYVLRETVDSTAPKPELLFKKVQELADAHLSTAVSPLLDKVLGKNAPKKRGKRRSEDAAYCDDSDDAEVEAEDDDGEEVAEAELLGEVKPALLIVDKQQASSSSRSSGSDPRPAPPGRASSSRLQPHQAPESSDRADGGAVFLLFVCIGIELLCFFGCIVPEAGGLKLLKCHDASFKTVVDVVCLVGHVIGNIGNLCFE